MVLYDPPYSSRQLTECYRKLELSVSADWNSGGIGKSLGFEQIEIMLVAHGGHHNDTIVTVERKVS